MALAAGPGLCCLRVPASELARQSRSRGEPPSSQAPPVPRAPLSAAPLPAPWPCLSQHHSLSVRFRRIGSQGCSSPACPPPLPSPCNAGLFNGMQGVASDACMYTETFLLGQASTISNPTSRARVREGKKNKVKGGTKEHSPKIKKKVQNKGNEVKKPKTKRRGAGRR